MAELHAQIALALSNEVPNEVSNEGSPSPLPRQMVFNQREKHTQMSVCQFSSVIHTINSYYSRHYEA